jgi:predicted component of type VI protein secretion system
MKLLVPTGSQANVHAMLEAAIRSSAMHASATVYACAGLSLQQAFCRVSGVVVPARNAANAHAILEAAAAVQQCMIMQQFVLVWPRSAVSNADCARRLLFPAGITAYAHAMLESAHGSPTVHARLVSARASLS